MGRINNAAILVVLLFSNSQSTYANETILNHALSVGQAMSAFYMKSLSGGAKRYDESFNRSKEKALQTISQYESENGVRSKELNGRWQKILTELKLEYSEDFGWDIPYNTRMDFRDYLSDIYQLINKKKSEYKQINETLLFSSVQIESISARFFDVSSAYDGSVSLYDKDWDKLNPINISAEFKHNTLAILENKSLSHIKKSLKDATVKWDFIEKLVTNYNNDSPYFLVYSTKNSIYKSLEESIKKNQENLNQ